MKTFRLVLFMMVLVVTLNADTAPKQPTLSEVISDAKYLSGSMGRTVLLMTDDKTGEVLEGLQEAIKQTGLDTGRQLHPFPREATKPVPVKSSRVPPVFPRELRRSGVSGQAAFIFVIGADGTVKSLFCYKSSRREFALAAAEAVARWRFTPAIFKDTPVPVVASQTLEFNTN